MTGVSQAFTSEERQLYIGCSEFGAVLGIDKYKTPLDIYNTKLGLVPAFEGNNHTLRGQRMERIAAELYTELTGNKLRRQSKAFIHPAHPFIVGHIDRIVEGKKQIAEIKCPSVAAYRRIQREGLPDSMICQMQGYLGLSGYESGVFIIFCADQMDVLSFEVEFDQDVYSATIKAAADLWVNHIEPQIPPTVNDADKPQIEFQKTSGSVTPRDDDSFREAALLLREANQLKKDGEELYDLAKTKVLDAIESIPGCYEGSGLRLHYTEQVGRKSFDKKALAAAHPEIDLSRFEKTGEPIKTFRPYFINAEGE